MTQLRTTQIFDTAKATSLDQILSDLTIGTAAGSITLPNGTIVKWGATGAYPSIGTNLSAVETLVFPVAFPTQCDFFTATLTPATSTDFYGMTSLVTKSASQVQFTARNGATAQAITGGVWFAIGQ
jgi:hypothetical protein